MQTVISLVLAILLCELLSVSTLQNNMTTQAGNFVEAQAGTNANVVNEWLVEEGNIVHTIRNGVAFMNTKDTDQIMDYLEVNLADAVAGVNKNLQGITYSSENMSTETKGVLQSIGKLQQNMRQFRV
ncbi:hypothetical protein DXC82_09800 [Clostridium sp. TF08-15]|jgi:hypothetical protein|nr:hypothetical protein DXC82_09800 [Clostridium sp. TF08-15]